jgi:hypothetical protein
MQVILEQGPEGSPGFCFGLYAADSGECVEFIQSDWDYAGLASSLGWCPCECGATDGTVNCAHRTVSEMLSEASDYLSERAGQVFDLADYSS